MTNKELFIETVKRARREAIALNESEQFGGLRLEISWDTKNPFRKRYEVQ